MERYINGETVFSITVQPGVSRSTVYAWMKAYRTKRDNTWYAKRREELLEKIQKIYDDSKRPFCADKTAAVTREKGYRVSLEMVRELMRDMGPISIRQDAKSLYDKETRRYENHLNQQFTAKNPYDMPVLTAPDCYLDEIKSVAAAFGYTPEAIDRLASMGFSAEDLKGFLYCGEI